MNKRQRTFAFEREQERIKNKIQEIRISNTRGSFEGEMWFDRAFDDILDGNVPKTAEFFDSGHPARDADVYEAYQDGLEEGRQFILEEPDWKNIIEAKDKSQSDIEREMERVRWIPKYESFFDLPPEERQRYFLEKNWEEAIRYPQKERGGRVHRIGRMK